MQSVRLEELVTHPYISPTAVSLTTNTTAATTTTTATNASTGTDIRVLGEDSNQQY